MINAGLDLLVAKHAFIRGGKMLFLRPYKALTAHTILLLFEIRMLFRNNSLVQLWTISIVGLTAAVPSFVRKRLSYFILYAIE